MNCLDFRGALPWVQSTFLNNSLIAPSSRQIRSEVMNALADNQPADARIEGRFKIIGTSPERRKPRTRGECEAFRTASLEGGRRVGRQADVWSAHGKKIRATTGDFK